VAVSATAPRASAAPRRRRALGALRHRNSRLFFGGQLVSMVGTWTQSIALAWLVLVLTHSGLLLGLVLAVQYLPMLAAGPVGGMVANRFPKRRVLQATQAASVAPSLILLAVSLTHAPGDAGAYLAVLGAALLWGVIQMVDVPTRQAFAIEMVGRDDLVNAIALNSGIWNAAAVIGPALAGTLIGLVGLPVCFLLNAATYAAMAAGLALMHDLPSLLPARDRRRLLDGVLDGFRYVRRDPLVLGLVLAVATFSVLAMNRLTLVALFSAQVLGAGAAGLGLLMAAQGLGALTGAVTQASAPGQASGRRQFWLGCAWAALLLGFTASPWLPLSVALLFLAGLLQVWFLTGANTRIQRATPERLRGRVMAFYTQAVMGLAPLGAIQAGALASLLGAPVAMAVGVGLAAVVLLGVRVLSPNAFTLEPTESGDLLSEGNRA
jgi:MFS family permease